MTISKIKKRLSHMIRVRRKGKIKGKSKLILRKEEKEEAVKRDIIELENKSD